MLSDEEKKAIEVMKEVKARNVHTFVDELSIVLNLIKKQSEEIEELKEKNEYLPNWVNKKYVSKDKIKAKIEEVDKDENASISDFMEYAKEYATQKLQSLLERE